MTHLVTKIGRIALTLLFVAGAIVALVLVWDHYEHDPWTRDGKIEADIVQVAPDVSGLVTGIKVYDNQPVVPGQTLFIVDHERYQAKLAQSDAMIASAKAKLDNAIRERARYVALGDLVSRETTDQKITAVETARAQLEQDRANRRLAAIDLERSAVTSRITGYVTGFSLRPGDYVQSGQPQFALVDTSSYYVSAYFEETKLHQFRIGDRAKIELLGDDRPLYGHVVSITAGIANRENSGQAGMLPNITPTFSWIRLAQRVPVRIVIDRVPANMRLVVGRTATVTILPTANPRAMDRRPTSYVPANTVPQGSRPALPAAGSGKPGAVPQ